MSGSVNRVILIGNLGADPEVRSLPSGSRVVNMRLACTESWRDKNTGERKDRTEWVSVVIFNEGLAKVAEQYLRKGSKVYIEGSLQTRKWQDQSGQDRYSTEVVLQAFNSSMTLLDNAGSSSGRTSDFDSENARSNRAPATSRPAASHAPAFDPGGDSIPFAPQWR